MKRRSFIGSIGAFLSGAVLDPERLLWIPGAKIFSIPNLVDEFDDFDLQDSITRFFGQDFHQTESGPDYVRFALHAGAQ